MPFTGVDFKEALDVKTDRAYSAYFDDIKMNIILKEAILKAIDKKIATNDRVQVQSDLFAIYKANQVYVPINNTVDLVQGTGDITDYDRVMYLKAQFIEPCSSALRGYVYIMTASQSTPVRIKLNVNTNVRTGSEVLISGITSNTNANGVRYIKQISNKIYELYADPNFITPIVGNGNYIGSVGAISYIHYNTANNLKSNRKFSVLSKPESTDPYFELANGVLNIYPLTKICSEVTIDYISSPVYIDVTDAVTDLLATYSQRFIYFVMDETALLMGMISRDNEMANNEMQQIIEQ